MAAYIAGELLEVERRVTNTGLRKLAYYLLIGFIFYVSIKAQGV